jgi:predicted AAA+ superfamily ATPase
LENAYLLDYLKLYAHIKDQVSASPHEHVYILLDEIQQVEQWERAVASFLVDFDCDVVITGSNASLLSSELATLLSGRYVEIRVSPLSFREFTTFIDQSSTMKDDSLWSYLTVGGLPGVHAMPPEEGMQRAYLQDVLNSVILSDVVQRSNIRNIDLLNRLFLYVASNIGNTFSASTIAAFLKNQRRKVGAETVHNYLAALSGAFAVNKVSRYDLQGKKILETQEKYFLEDLGLRHAMLGFQPDAINGMLENIVYLELRRRGYDVMIGKMGTTEVDFVATKQNDRVYVQVSYQITSEKVRDREFSPLRALSDSYPKYVLTLDNMPEYNIDGVKRMNIEDFLFGK